VLLPDLTDIWAPLALLIDTGAGATCVHPQDAVVGLRLNIADLIDPTRWPSYEDRGGIGGSALYYIVHAEYAFRRENGPVQRLQGELRIAAPSRANENLPSIMGWDILLHFRFTADWRARDVRLES
jgi:hypothetical protein